MHRSVRMTVVAAALSLAFAGGAWTASAQNERHPVLRASIRQLEGIKDRLEKAPSDFGGHKAAAIESINHAMTDLRQAIEFDRK